MYLWASPGQMLPSDTLRDKKSSRTGLYPKRIVPPSLIVRGGRQADPLLDLFWEVLKEGHA